MSFPISQPVRVALTTFHLRNEGVGDQGMASPPFHPSSYNTNMRPPRLRLAAQRDSQWRGSATGSARQFSSPGWPGEDSRNATRQTTRSLSENLRNQGPEACCLGQGWGGACQCLSAGWGSTSLQLHMGTNLQMGHGKGQSP